MRILPLFTLCLLLVGCSSAPEIIIWESTGGPHAQNLTTLFVDEMQPSHLYAGLATGAVYLSTNHGASWRSLSVIRPATRIHRFIPDPGDSRRLYAATEAGLFVSTDRGSSWTGIATTGDEPCLSLVIEPFNTSTMYTGITGRGIAKSTDGGATWNPSNGGLDPTLLLHARVHDITINPTQPEHIVAALSSVGVIASTNGGATWSRLMEASASIGVAPVQILIHPKMPERMVLGMSGGTLYASRNSGLSWSPTRLGTGGNSYVSLASHRGNGDMIYAATESEVLVSSDFGTTWKTLSGKLPRLATSLAMSPERTHPAMYVYGQGLGLQRSTDEGTSWVHADNGLGGSTVTRMSGTRTDGPVYAVVGTGVYRLAPGESGWTPASNGLTGGTITALTADTDSLSFAYAATENGLFKTTNTGGAWFPASPSMNGRPIAYFATHPIISSRMFLANNDGLFVSIDRGLTWKPTRPLDGRYAMNEMTFSPTNAGLIYGATSNQAVITSTDGGFRWQSTRYGLAENDIRSVSLDVNNSQVAYTWTARGDGFRTTNSGIVWDRYTPPWNPGERSLIAIDKFRPSSAVALVEGTRLYHTANGGATWVEIPVEPLKLDPQSAYWTSRSAILYIGAKDSGVYRLELGAHLRQRFGRVE